MADNKINTRIQLKNDTEEHWNQAENFIPRQGEVIIYNVDNTHLFPRIKVGDGSSYVNALPFITTPFESLPTGTSASTVAIGDHTHSLNNLTKKALTTSTINTNKTTDIIYSSSSGKFFGHSSNVDWVGLQFGTSNDRFQLIAQLVADSNTLLFRQNDYASPTASNWSAWQQFVHIPFNGGNGGAGNSGSKEEGSETVATPVYITTNGTATPIAYTIGSDVPIGAVFTDTNQYHKTGSWNGLTYTADAVNSADELAFTIPTGTSSTTVAAGDHNHNSTYLKLDGSNNMNADVNIIAGDQDTFVNFLYNAEKKAGASWRLGMLGTGLEDAKYFVIQSGTSTISDTNWTNALQIGMNTHDIYIPSTTASTSTSTGALTVGGGLGVAGQVTAGTLKSGNITIGGTVDTNAGKTISCNSTLYINRGANTSIIFSENSINEMRIDTSNAFRPETTNTLSIGTSDKKWANVYATNLHGTLATTDLSDIVSTTARKFLKDTGDWAQVDWGDLTGTPTMTSISTPNTLVERDANGDFSARNITMTQGNIGNMILAGTTIAAVTIINTSDGNGLLAYKPSDWTGVTTSQWAVGTVDIQGVIRSNNSDLLHSRNGTNSVIFDADNYKTYTYALDGSNTGTTLKISTQSSAYTNQIQFMNNATKKGSVGCDNNGAMCMYGASKIALRPILDASTDGVEITTSAMTPTKNNTMELGGASNKWATVYATTFDGKTTSLTHTTNASDGLKIKYSTTVDFFIGVGTGNINHGLYDNKASGGARWILFAGSGNVWTFVGDVTGNVSGSSGSCTGNAATATTASNLASITSADAATSSATWRRLWISYNDNTTGRPAYTDNLVYQTSTNTLKTPHLLIEHASGDQAEMHITYGSTIDYWWGVETANVNHGLYDNKANKWILSAGANNTWSFDGNAATATSATTATNLSAAPTITQVGSSGTTLSAATFYTLTVGGQTVVFKTPIDTNDQVTQNIKTDNKKYGIILSNYETSSSVTTAAEVNRDSKVYVNPSLNSVNAGQFVLHDKAATPVEKAYMVWNATDQSIDFVFN